jgi:hypothetical protein
MPFYGKVVLIIIFGGLRKTAMVTVNYKLFTLHCIKNRHEWEEVKKSIKKHAIMIF